MSTMGYVATLSGAEDTSSLSLDFEKNTYKVKGVSKTFNELFTTVRPTRAGRVNEKGLYELVEANQPRFDYDPITKVLKGLLVEETRTNALLFSEKVSGTNWGRSNVGVNSKAPVVVENAGIAPDGKLTAASVSFYAQDITSQSILNQGIVATAGATYNGSIYLKAKAPADVGKILYFRHAGSGKSPVKLVTLTDQWQRASMDEVTYGTNSRFELMLRPQLATSNGTVDCLVWGAQFEPAGLTSYIPSTTTFTSRASSATYFDKDGVLKTAGVSIAREDAYGYLDGTLHPIGLLTEQAATNLLTRTNSIFSWYVLQSISVQYDGTRFIDGVQPMMKLVESLDLNRAVHTAQLTGVSIPADSTHTISFFAKSAGRGIRLELSNGWAAPDWPNIYVNLKDFTFTANGGAVGAVKPMGGGMCRISLTVTRGSTPWNGALVFRPFDDTKDVTYIGDGVSGLYIGGFQIETGTAMTSYIPSTDTFTSRSTTATYFDSNKALKTAAVNEARSLAYDWDDKGNWKPLGLLEERYATNLALQSNSATTFSTLLGATYVDNGQLFVDGTSPLCKLVESNESRDHNGRQAAVLIPGALTTYTSSFIVKAAERTKLRMLSTAGRIDFDLTAMTCTVLSSYAVVGRIEKLGDGFVRISITARTTVDNTSITNYIYLLDNLGASIYQGDGVSGLFVGGYQVEVGASASSYIPTTTAQVTRAADGVSSVQATRAADIISSAQATRNADRVSIADISTWYNQPESTFLAEFTPGGIEPGSLAMAFRMRNAGTFNQDYASIYKDTTQKSVLCSIGNNTGQTQMNLTIANVSSKEARVRGVLSYKLNSGGFSVNGVTTVTDSALLLPTPTFMAIGQNGEGTWCANGYIHSIQYYPLRLSDSQVQLLSS